MVFNGSLSVNRLNDARIDNTIRMIRRLLKLRMEFKQRLKYAKEMYKSIIKV